MDNSYINSNKWKETSSKEEPHNYQREATHFREKYYIEREANEKLEYEREILLRTLMTFMKVI